MILIAVLRFFGSRQSQPHVGLEPTTLGISVPMLSRLSQRA